MKEIPLTQGFVALVDDEDYDALSRFKWNALVVPRSDLVYATRSVTIAPGKHRSISMHRQIMGFPLNDVDHKDRNGLNCQRYNLRACTTAQNLANQKRRKNNTSGAKGVDWVKKDKRWRARIEVNGTRLHLGNHKNKSDAQVAYDDAAKKYRGEFARTA